MLDIGWSEMALILMVALIVIGPKDLPRVARTMGKWSARARSMAREFQRSLEDMAREAELEDIKREVDKVTRTDVRAQLEHAIDPEGEMRRSIAPPREEPTSRTGAKDVSASSSETRVAAPATSDAAPAVTAPAASSSGPAEPAEKR